MLGLGGSLFLDGVEREMRSVFDGAGRALFERRARENRESADLP